MKKEVKGIETIPFGGGADIRHQNEPSLVTKYSAIQNFRNMHPGLKQRAGCVKLHMTADGTNEVMSLFQFSKGRVVERHLYAQMSDGDVLEATNAPPAITPEVMSLDVSPATDWAAGDIVTGQTSGKTCQVVAKLTATTYSVLHRNGAFTIGEVVGVTGVAAKLADQGAANPTFAGGEFGTEVHNGTASGMVPASWSVLDDRMVYSNGSDQHQIYPGSDQYVKKVVYVDATSAVPTVVNLGTDYTEQATDGLSATVIPLDSFTTEGAAVNAFSDNADSQSLTTTNIVADDGSNAANWIPTGGSATSVAGGQAGNCISLANVGSNQGRMRLADITTVVGETYGVSFYFKKGTCASGYVSVGSAAAPTALGTSSAFTDVNWTQHTIFFVATATSTRVTFWNSSSTDTETSLWDTVSIDLYDTNSNWVVGALGAMIPIASGATSNGYQLNNSSSGTAASLYHDVTTEVGKIYTISYSFKKGTGVSGKLNVGTTGSPSSLYDSGALTDADWTAKSGTFTATATTTRITLINTSTIFEETSLFDTILLYSSTYKYLYIKTDLPATGLKFTVSAANGDAAVAIIKYWNGAWTDCSITDGTIASAGKTLGQTGSMTWTLKTDEYPYYMFDESGFWYQFSLSSGTLDAEVEISAIQYNTTWQGIQNVWDGVPIYAVEASFYDQSSATYLTYPSDAITVSAMTASDILYFNSAAPIVGFYVGVGATPNTTATTTINAVNYFDGITMKSVGTIYDGTAGLSKSGWVIFGRQSDVQPRQLNDSRYFSYWYSFTVDKTLSASLSISIETMPYFLISDFGSEGLCSCSWHDRMLYVFKRYPTDIVVSKSNEPMVLNGGNFGFLETPGDGRSNRVICMRNIGESLLTWQEEKGQAGGTITKYSWVSSLTDIKKTVVSTVLGTFSNKSVDIVSGVEFSELNRDSPIMALAFCLSRSGVYITDGTSCYMISGDIANYFDPNDSTCIRAGYENKMWLKYDSSCGVVRIGLVSGSSATLPNVFPVYDVKAKQWLTDSLAQELSCMAEVEAGSGNVPVLQIGGGIDDGQVYLLNSGLNDVSTAIDAFATLEFDAAGNKMCVEELLFRAKSQAAGNVTITPYENGIARTALTFAQTAAETSQVFRRHRRQVNIEGNHVSLKFQHNTASESCYLLDYGVRVAIREDQ